MKIALVGNAFPPDFVGGTEVVMAAQARELLTRGHRVRVVVASEDVGAIGGQLERRADGLELLRIALPPEEFASEHRPRTASLVEEGVRGFDLVHVHHTARFSDDLVRRLGRRKPVLLSLHDHFASCPRVFRRPVMAEDCPPDMPDGNCVTCVAPLVPQVTHELLAARLSARWRERRAEVRAARCVIVPSAHLRESLQRELRLEGEEWQLVPHGLCRALEAPARAARRAGPLTVLSFGNRTDLKGSADLVRAMADLSPGSARLVLAGAELRSGFDAELRRLAGTLPLELHGAYDEARLSELAAASDLAAFPSRAEESYGLVVEEALALGLATWVSDRGALPEVLERAGGGGAAPGGVLPAEDPGAWTRELRALVDSPRRLQDARARLPRGLRSASQAVDELLELYSRALRERALGAH